MRCARNYFVWFLLAVFGPVEFLASAVVNPYVDSITNRNMFGLKAPPTAEELAAQNVKPAEPLPKVLLTGITTLMGGKMALLRVQRPAKAPEPAKEIPLILAENAPAEEEVQVLEINVAAGTVKITNRGTQQELDIMKDSPKGAPAGGGGAPAGVPGLRPGMTAPGAGGSVPPPGGGIPIPPRPLRSGADSAAQTAAPMGAGSVSAQASKPAAPPITLEEQVILMHVNNIQNPDHPPTPPTELTELLEEEGGGPAMPGGPPGF